MYDLSILIPARNEMFLARTVQDILDNSEGKTEVIVVLDGVLSDPPVVDDDRVTVVYLPESIGQRAATNMACRLSKAKYVAKCDAHVAFDKGFDVKLIKMIEGHDDWTVAPAMKNLHAFDWECPKCGSRWYQGPTPDQCLKNKGKPGNGTELNLDCDNTQGFVRKIVWSPNGNRPTSTSFCFDSEPHFQYFKEFARRPEGQGDITESMSLQGSFFMMTREKYWELDICNEQFGSWGSQGIEVAVKTWLSGGKVMINHNTWYAHMFRTQGGDFSFSYPQPQSKIVEAKTHAKNLFFGNNWEKQIRPLSWLLEKFWPVTGWTDADLLSIKEHDNKVTSKGIIFFTDNRLNLKIAHAVQNQLKKIGLPIVSSSLKPMTFGDKNVVIDAERGYHTYFKQIVAALEASKAEIVFFCEHDVLYPPSHFEFTPPRKDVFYYNHNWIKVRTTDGFAVHWDADQVSGLVCYRELALAHYTKILESFNRDTFDRKFEPGSGVNSESWMSKDTYVDIRHGQNLTKEKWSLADFRDKTTAKNFKEVECPKWAKDILL